MSRALRQGTLIGMVVAATACSSREGTTGGGGTGNGGPSGEGPAAGAPGTGGDGGTGGTGGSGSGNKGDAGAANVNGGTAGTAGAHAAGSGGGGTDGGGDSGRGGDPSAGRAGDAGGSEAGAPNESECAGPFGEERVLIARGKNEIVASPTVSGDELELFFMQRNPNLGVARQVYRSERAARDADFGEPAPVPELDDVCSENEDRALSITGDGLRLYVGCYTGVGMVAPGPLRLARRSDRNAPFVLDDTTYGTVGGGASLSADELSLRSSSETDVSGEAPPMEYARSSLERPFADGHTIAGLDEVFLLSPFLAPDGLALFGGLSPDLVVMTRADPGAAFGAPKVLIKGDRSTVVYSSAELSADCKTLYFLHATIADGLATYSISVAGR